MLKDVRTGLIYRNPKPHVRSVHAYFPSVAVMANGEMLATMALGQAFESADSHTCVARSKDRGETWELQGPIYGGTTDRVTSDYCRITALPDGEVVAFMIRSDRTDHPDEGLANPENLGFVPMDLLLLRSRDFGRTWSAPAVIQPPLTGPSFEMCSPIVPLKDGRWVLPTLTWPGWDGSCLNGIREIGLVSHDRGRTWPEYMDIMHEPGSKVFFWESKIVELGDGRLMAVAWVYDDNAHRDRPNHYALSTDGGKRWTRPISTGLPGQTLTPFVLDDGRILCVYRRMDNPGLWANLSHLEGETWINDAEQPLWGHQAAGLTGTSENMVRNFNVLRFGAPCITRLADGTIYTAFWCYEDCVSNIRWFKFRV